MASAASSSRRRVSITSSPGAKPDCTSHLRIGSVGYAGGLPANTVTTVAPGCAAMKFAQPKTASSRWGDTITTRPSSPARGTPHSRIGASSPKLFCSTMRVQPGVDALRLLVDRAELTEQLVVDRPVGPFGIERLNHADAPCDVGERRSPEPERSECGGTARVGTDRVLDLADRPVEHVGHDPAPQARLRAAADVVE